MNNREIKFRVFDKNNNKMIPASDVPWVEASINGKYVNLLTVAMLDGPNKGFIPLQFTGLKDSKNKEIYEGDIVKYISKDKTYEIKFYQPNACFVCLPTDIGPNMMEFMCCVNILDFVPNYRLTESSFEIIGNIYENSDLLEIK